MDGYGSSLLGQWEWIVYAIESSPYPHRRVLDVGAGYGKGAILMREKLNVKPEVIDALEPNLDHLVHQLGGGTLYGAVSAERAETYGRYEFYDTVLMADVIEHMDQATGMRVLNAIPGQIVVSTPVDALAANNEGVPELEQHVSQWTLGMFRQVAKLGHRTLAYWNWPKVDPQQLIVLLGPKGQR